MTQGWRGEREREIAGKGWRGAARKGGGRSREWKTSDEKNRARKEKQRSGSKRPEEVAEETEGTRYNGSFTTERFNCPCFVVGGHSTSSTPECSLCAPRHRSYFLSFSPSGRLAPAEQRHETRNRFIIKRGPARFCGLGYRDREGGRETEGGGSGGGCSEGRTRRGTEKRIQMVGMNSLWGRIADNAPLYLVAGANSYRFVIDSYNEHGICPSCIAPCSLDIRAPQVRQMAAVSGGERITGSNHFVTDRVSPLADSTT